MSNFILKKIKIKMRKRFNKGIDGEEKKVSSFNCMLSHYYFPPSFIVNYSFHVFSRTFLSYFFIYLFGVVCFFFLCLIDVGDCWKFTQNNGIFCIFLFFCVCACVLSLDCLPCISCRVVSMSSRALLEGILAERKSSEIYLYHFVSFFFFIRKNTKLPVSHLLFLSSL